MLAAWPPLRASAYSTFVLDQDGVLFHGEKPIAGALETVQRLRASGKRVFFVTNNSGKSRGDVAARLQARGVVGVHAEDVVTAGSAAAAYLRARSLTSAYVVGEPGLLEELAAAGVACSFEERSASPTLDDDAFQALFQCPRPDAVVVGLDSRLTYRKLATASAFVQRGAAFIGTNPDAGDRIGPGLAPGAGSLIAAVEAASGCKATVVGKPEPAIVTELLAEHGLSAASTLFVGDRLDTDVLCGAQAGCGTCLVLTGVATLAEAEALAAGDRRRPDYVLSSLADLVVQ